MPALEEDPTRKDERQLVVVDHTVVHRIEEIIGGDDTPGPPVADRSEPTDPDQASRLWP